MKTVVVYSGGMDSFTLLHDMLEQGDEVFAVTFAYGQRHVKEIQYARAVCKQHDIRHNVVNLRGLDAGSALTSLVIDVPEGHYEDESMRLTVVPNRNMIMLAMAIGHAVFIKADRVVFGAHAGDHAIYPDCRAQFVSAMNNLALIANYHAVTVAAPYLGMTKGDIAKLGKELGLDYGDAWTCYNGREKACSKCGACQERIEAMAFAGIDDPMEYEI